MTDDPETEAIANIDRPSPFKQEVLKSFILPIGQGAEMFFENLWEHIRFLEETLEDDEQIVFVHSTSGDALFVESITYHNPSAIAIFGRDVDGARASVFAHVSSVQILFKVAKVVAGEPRRPIGFEVVGQVEANQERA